MFWERNYFTESLPILRVALRNHYVRGAISGLGLVNLALGLAELIALIAWRRPAAGSFDHDTAHSDGALPNPE